MALKKKKKLGNYPYFTVIFSITLALFTLGIFGLVFIFSKNLSDKIQNNYEVHVFLDNDLNNVRINHIESVLKSKPYVKELSYTSAEEALRKYVTDQNESPEDLLGYNPLHAFFTVTLDGDFSHQEAIKKAEKELSALAGVHEVEFLKDFIDTINKNLNKIGMVILSIFAVLMFVVFVLINNTIKLALFSQRFIIRSMQLVGATSWFIQRPFLWRAIWQGALSGIIAILAIFGFLNMLYDRVEELKLLEDVQSFGVLVIIILVIGALIGFISSYRAVNKYLKMSLEDLY